MPPQSTTEIQRVEDALYRFCPFRQWDIKTVVFPATANTDLDITHSLTPDDPEAVDFMVLHKSRPCEVYRYSRSDRVPWSAGVVRLRCTAESATVTILFTTGDDGESRAVPDVTTENVEFPASFSGASAGTVTIGRVGDGNIAAGPGIEIDGALGNSNGLVGKWALSAYEGPLGGGVNFRALALNDMTGGILGETPFIFWHDGSEYYLSPDDITQSTIGVNLGDLRQSTGQGRFTRIYARGLDVGLFNGDNSADGVISASNGYRERGRTTAMGEWATWTPTWTNLTVGNGTVDARHTKIGKTVHFRLEITFGSTTSISGAMAVTVPSTMQSANSINGDVLMVDQGVGFYPGNIAPNSTTVISLFDDSSPLATVTSTNPFTFGSTDVILIYGTYEEA